MKNSLYEMHAQMCRIFTSPKRIEVLNILREKEMSVMDISAKANINQANLSQHLSIMREKGILKTRREGTAVYYSLANPKIMKVCDIMREIVLEKLSQGGELAKSINKK